MDTKRVLAGVCGLSSALLLVGAVMGACTVTGGADDPGFDTGGDYGSDTSGNSVGVGTTGGFPDEPAPPPATGDKDAGPDADDAPFQCDGLDPAKPLVLYLSADDSNSMASPVHAREIIKNGGIPSKNQIRTYEFLNYYRIAYDAPPAGQLSIIPQAEVTADPAELNLQLAVRSFEATKPRRPITITFVLDTSGSMDGPAIERERAAASAIAASLAEGDVVNMVTWNTENNTILDGYQVTGPNDDKLLEAIGALQASGGTDLHSGLVSGYALAQANYGPGRLNRVILISDGGANVGITDEDIIAQNSADADKEGIYMVGVGAGPASSYNDFLMDTVTDKGRGAYVYLDEPAEAARMFTDRFDETMEVAARGVQVEVTLPWYFRIEKFYGEEYSENPEEIEPQHLAPSDAMIFSQVLRACDASQIKQDDSITVTARWKVPITYEAKETKITMTVADILAGGHEQLRKGTAIVAYAEALKTGNSAALHDALSKVQAANAGKNDPELTEIEGLIQMHPAF